MEGTSPSNLSNSTKSKETMDHQLGDCTMAANDLTAAALNDIWHETINFMANIAPSLWRALNTETCLSNH